MHFGLRPLSNAQAAVLLNNVLLRWQILCCFHEPERFIFVAGLHQRTRRSLARVILLLILWSVSLTADVFSDHALLGWQMP
jgi:hypothetical protein